MKLSVIGDEISQDISEVIETAREQGYTGIEVRSVCGLTPDELTPSLCRSIAQTINEAGLKVAAFASPIGKEPLPRTRLMVADVTDRFKRAVETAMSLGAPRIRIFSFFREGRPDPMAAAAALDAMITVDDLEIEIVVETGTLTNTVRASDLAAVLLALQQPFVGALWDPGNGVYSAMDPDPLLAYGTLREWIRHVHVKDPLGQSHYAPIGRGSTPWKEIVGRMATDGYRGYLSLETHWRRERILSKEELDCPWGNTFSAGGKEASSLCMAALKDVVEAECDRHLR